MKEIVVGYQGIKGSNSFYVAKKFMLNNHIGKYKLKALINSKNVIEKLIKGEINYGVVAVNNNLGGVVKETQAALKGVNYKIIDKLEELIHHSLFTFDNNYSYIKNIISHEQALKQCKKYIKANYDCKIVNELDTALAAKKLSRKEYDITSTAVICRKEAGKSFGLNMIDNEIEDNESITTFLLIEIIL